MKDSWKEKLFMIIRFGMEAETSDDKQMLFSGETLLIGQTLLSEEDCERLIQTGRRQSTLPILYNGLRRMSCMNPRICPSETLKSLDRARNRDVYRCLQHDESLKRIRTALNDAQIPYILLKGAVLRNLYPDPLMRTSSDIDILVQEKHLDQAVRVLEERTDFTVHKRNYHDMSMVSRRVHLELHFHIKEMMENIDPLLIRVWEYAQPTEEGSLYVLSPEFQIFHVIAHMSYHMVHGGLGIRPFLDLWLLREKTTYDETIVRDMCSETSILTFYEKCCSLTEVWMGECTSTDGGEEELPDPTLSVFENYCLDGGVFGSVENTDASMQREHRGLPFLAQKIFLNKKELEARYPELEDKPYLFFPYQARRWLKLLKAEKRRRVSADLKRILTMEEEKIEAFDRLLTSLGL